MATHGSASAGYLAFTSSLPIPKSGLAETEHILIFPNEIETLNISPALVVLSSCDSGQGQMKAEGVKRMARAFLLEHGSVFNLTTVYFLKPTIKFITSKWYTSKCAEVLLSTFLTNS